jgi:hypothetical protein
MRILIILIAFSVYGYTALGQGKLFHSVGATISYLYAHSQNTDPGSDYHHKISTDILQTNFSYFPRYNLIEGGNSSLSAGMPLAVGVGVYTNTLDDDAAFGFSYDIPVVVDFNMGCMSTKSNENHFGGYIGAGFGYYSIIISGSKYSDFKGYSYGPLGRAGVRFSFPEWNGKGVAVGTFYKVGLESAKFSTIGFNILADL